MTFNETKSAKAEAVKYRLSGLTTAFNIIVTVLVNEMVAIDIGFT